MALEQTKLESVKEDDCNLIKGNRSKRQIQENIQASRARRHCLRMAAIAKGPTSKHLLAATHKTRMDLVHLLGDDTALAGEMITLYQLVLQVAGHSRRGACFKRLSDLHAEQRVNNESAMLGRIHTIVLQ